MPIYHCEFEVTGEAAGLSNLTKSLNLNLIGVWTVDAGL